MAWVRRVAGGMKVVLKGILSPEDAVQAAAAGVDAIVVSNHGGRQLDTVASTLEALVEVRAALGRFARENPAAGVPEVLVDGGVRRGSDVVKAVGLGARAVFVGRPALWGLAQGGAMGVGGVLGLLREEFRVAVTLLGCRGVGELEGRVRMTEEMERAAKRAAGEAEGKCGCGKAKL
ncbi:hypothetical protein HDU96_004297 [Phlyctochytrium bullatum]|nr:hypothetical protein HDU96_004297 [Phlyctochytrium bullatum]